jgi:hypothetical protein
MAEISDTKDHLASEEIQNRALIKRSHTRSSKWVLESAQSARPRRRGMIHEAPSGGICTDTAPITSFLTLLSASSYMCIVVYVHSANEEARIGAPSFSSDAKDDQEAQD